MVTSPSVTGFVVSGWVVKSMVVADAADHQVIASIRPLAVARSDRRKDFTPLRCVLEFGFVIIQHLPLEIIECVKVHQAPSSPGTMQIGCQRS